MREGFEIVLKYSSAGGGGESCGLGCTGGNPPGPQGVKFVGLLLSAKDRGVLKDSLSGKSENLIERDCSAAALVSLFALRSSEAASR